jgi:hypothetical protein
LNLGSGRYYNYNAFTCAQLQQEVADVHAEASKALNQRPFAIRVDPSEMLSVTWPDMSQAEAQLQERFRAQFAAIEITARGKACAIRFGSRVGSVG